MQIKYHSIISNIEHHHVNNRSNSIKLTINNNGLICDHFPTIHFSYLMFLDTLFCLSFCFIFHLHRLCIFFSLWNSNLCQGDFYFLYFLSSMKLNINLNPHKPDHWNLSVSLCSQPRNKICWHFRMFIGNHKVCIRSLRHRGTRESIPLVEHHESKDEKSDWTRY